MPTPGPSYIIILGLWMVAGEWLLMARLFDRVEVRLRKAVRWAKDTWARSPLVMIREDGNHTRLSTYYHFG